MNNLGRHVLADVYLLEWPGDDAVMAACERALEVSKMTVVSQLVKRFQPSGVTAVWVLSESHFSLHTYPEHKYISVDCYTCGEEGRPDLAVACLLDELKVKAANTNEIKRGAVA